MQKTAGPFGQQHHPRHPSQRGDVAGPHPAIQGQPVPGEHQAGEAGGEAVAKPAHARKYMPMPARKTWPRMKKFIAQGMGSNS